MNLSYPKKIVNSSIENEFLTGFTNFRYKKVNILMGANATGKTSFGKMLMNIFHFMDKKQYADIVGLISDKTKEAAFCIDFVANMKYLFRVNTVISPPEEGQKLTGENIDVSVRFVEIQKKDSYESCLKRLLETKQEKDARSCSASFFIAGNGLNALSGALITDRKRYENSNEKVTIQ